MNSIPVLFLFPYKNHSIDTIYRCMSTVFVYFLLVWIFLPISDSLKAGWRLSLFWCMWQHMFLIFFVFGKFWSRRLWLVGKVLGINVSTTCANMRLLLPLAIQCGRLSFFDWSVEFRFYYRHAHVWTCVNFLSKTRCDLFYYDKQFCVVVSAFFDWSVEFELFYLLAHVWTPVVLLSKTRCGLFLLP